MLESLRDITSKHSCIMTDNNITFIVDSFKELSSLENELQLIEVEYAKEQVTHSRCEVIVSPVRKLHWLLRL